jgi:hypothetical protein
MNTINQQPEIVVTFPTSHSDILANNIYKNSPVAGPEEPKGFQEVKVPRFRDNGTGWW